MANRADRGLMRSYMTSVRELIETLRFGPIFYRPMRQALFAWIFHLGFYQVARWRVRRWEQDPTHQAQLQQMHEFARRNVTLPPGLSTQAREQYLRQASHRYRVYWEALQLSGLTRRKNRVVAMYLDGSQHHIRQTVALHLTTLDKGNVTQPWQGAGALLDNGHGKLEPFVLTAGRLQRYTVQTVDGLELVPCRGFERLAVVQACATAPGGNGATGALGPAQTPAP
jgi:hypothetical protein